MPVINPQNQGIPQEGSPSEKPETFEERKARILAAPVPDFPTSPPSTADRLAQMRQEYGLEPAKQQGDTSLGGMAKSTGKFFADMATSGGILATMLRGMYPEETDNKLLESWKQGSLTPAGAIRALAHHLQPEPPGVSTFDVAVNATLANVTGGIIKPLEHLPLGIGSGLVQPYLSPLAQQANLQAQGVVQQRLQEFPELEAETRTMAGVFGMAGHLAGWMIPFTGALRASKLVFGAKGLMSTTTGMTLPPILQDMAGGFTYGFFTGEKGLSSYLLPGGHKDSIESVARTHAQVAVVDLRDRLLASVSFGGDFMMLGMAFNALAKGAEITRSLAFMQGKFKTKISTKELFAELGGTVTADGKIVFPGISNAESAKIVAEITTITDMVMNDAKALKHIIEGSQLHDGIVEAVRNYRGMGGGEVGSIYGMVDPWAMMTATQKYLASRAKSMEGFRSTIMNVKGHLSPVALDASAVKANLTEGVPAYVVYGQGTPSVGRILQADLAGAGKEGMASMTESLLTTKNPIKQSVYESWLAATEDGKISVAELIERNTAAGREMIIIKNGKYGTTEVIPLREEAIRMVGEVDAGAAEKAMISTKAAPPPVDPNMGMITGQAGVEPMDVALARKFQDLDFAHIGAVDAAGKRIPGVYNTIFKPKDVPITRANNPYKLSWTDIKSQVKNQGFFEGQSVRYVKQPGSRYIYRGKTSGGKVRLEDPTTGKIAAYDFKNIRAGMELKSNIIDVELTEGFGTSFFNRFHKFVDDKLKLLRDRGTGLDDLEDIAKALEESGVARRDINLRGRGVLMPEEVPGGVESVLANAKSIQADIRAGGSKLDDIIIQHPEPPPNQMTLLWEEFLQQEGISIPKAHSEALMWSTFRKIAMKEYEALPKDIQWQWQNLSAELKLALEKLPNDIATQAQIRGWAVVPTREGYMLNMAGTKHYKFFKDDKSALAYLEEYVQLADDLLPGSDMMQLAVPGGYGFAPTLAKDLDSVFLTDETFENIVEYFARTGPSNAHTKNILRWAEKLEDESGIPIFTEIFEKLSSAKWKAGNASLPFIADVKKIFRKMSAKRRIAVYDALGDMESEAVYWNYTGEKWLTKVKSHGLDSKEIKAAQDLIELENMLWKTAAQHWGWNVNKSYFFNYHARIRKALTGNAEVDAEMFGKTLPNSIESLWARHIRHGNLSIYETDPLIVVQKYINAMHNDMYMGDSWYKAREFLNMKLKDVPQHLRKDWEKKVLRPGERAPGGLSDAEKGNRSAIPASIRRPTEAFLTAIRGYPSAGERTVKEFTKTIFKRLGIDASDKATEEFVNIAQATWFGAAIAFRPAPITRNLMQNIWTLYPRLGGRAMGEGWDRTFAEGGVERAYKAGAFKFKEVGIPYGEDIFAATTMEEILLEGTRGAGKYLAPALNVGLRLGQWSKKLSQRGLQRFSSSDILNRVWSYNSQRAYLEPLVTKFRAEKLTRVKFEDKALKFWGKTDRKNFWKKYEGHGGSEAAMDYLAVRASKLTQYVYGTGSQPLLMQGLTGRLFGTFGTWPIWMKDLMLATWKNGSGADRMLLAARAAMVTGSLSAMSYSIYGNINTLLSWNAYITPLTWMGGPGVTGVENLRDVITGPWEYKVSALLKMGRELAHLGFPGQLAIRDYHKAGKELDRIEVDPARVIGALLLGRAEHIPSPGPFTIMEAGIDQDLNPYGNTFEGKEAGIDWVELFNKQ